ncbi:MAG: hypothetical protein CM15mP117_17110 [Alphaproteobacteria bacterium]|nr:MAG: hypothetical protein CM15mP117_17110 [Alphaproteobacteria bacterium]
MSKIIYFFSKLFWFIFLLLFVILLAILVGSNSQSVNLYFWPISGKLTIVIWLVILLSFGAGLIAGALIIWLNSFSSYRASMKLKKQVQISTSDNTKIENDQYLEFKNSTKQPSDDNKQINSPFNGFTQGF